VALGSAGQATQSGIQVFGNMNVSASAGGGGNINASNGINVGTAGISIGGTGGASSLLTTTQTSGGSWQLNLSNGLNVVQQLTANGGISLGPDFIQGPGSLTPEGGGQFSITLSGWRFIWGYQQAITTASTYVGFVRRFTGFPLVMATPVMREGNGSTPTVAVGDRADISGFTIIVGGTINSPFAVAWLAIAPA
jgi:hypothetical protein